MNTGSLKAKCAGRSVQTRFAPLVFLILFAFLTFVLMWNRQPFFDEAHAWMVAKSFGFFDLLRIEKFEGHLFLWHTILSPFARNNLAYPYSMYILNWLFCILGAGVFVKFAPLSFIQKCLVLFSFPFLFYFGVVARCYSLGILFLFLLLSLWKEKVCHPIIFSFLLALFMNTSVMALIGAVPLAAVFVSDLIQSKISFARKLASLSVIFLAVFLVLVQLFGARHPDAEIMAGEHIFLYKILIYFSFLPVKFEFSYLLEKITAILIILTYFLSFFCFSKSKKSMVFHISTLLLLFWVFIFEYSGAIWHYTFFYVYLISALWIFKLEVNSPETASEKAFNLVFSTLSAMFVLSGPIFLLNSELYTSKTKEIADIVQNFNLFGEQNKVFALDNFSQTCNGILPYFNDAKLYNLFGDLKYTKADYHRSLQHFSNKDKIDFFANALSPVQKNYGITDRKMHKKYDGNHGRIVLSPIFESKSPKFMIYLIERESL